MGESTTVNAASAASITDNSAEIPAEAPKDNPDMPLPQDASAVFLGGLFILALLTCANLAKEVVLPVVLAIVLKLLLQPAMRFLERLRFPRVVAALTIIALLFALIAGFGEFLREPATNWATRLEEGVPRLQERVRIVTVPLDSLKRFMTRAQAVVSASTAPSSANQMVSPSSNLEAALLDGVQKFASQFMTTFLVLFFLLMSSDTFLRRLVEIVPRFRDKRQVIEISHQVEADISSYLVTITVMNMMVGVATGVSMWALGLENAMLWGAIAFLLNYVPILGPLTAMAIFLAAGMLSLEPLGMAFMPVITYTLIHALEGQTITPLLLARRFTLNPVLVIVALIFWYWMWGVPGAILAVPMLAITKIICDRIRPLAAIGHFLEGEDRSIRN